MTFEEYIDVFTYNKHPDRLKLALIAPENEDINRSRNNGIGTFITLNI